MKKLLHILATIVGIFMPFEVFSQFSTVLTDSFKVPEARIDLSELIIRYGETEAASAFEIIDYTDSEGLTFPSIHMNQTGEEAGVCCTYDNSSFIAHNCIDYVFPEPVLRSDGDTLLIEFDGIWEIANDKKGESGKLIAYLMYNYPEGGPPFGIFNDLSEDFYGKPAYQLWLLNGSNLAFMTYGAGLTDQGSFIKLPADNPQFWLPGFTDKRLAEGEIDQHDPYPSSDYGRLMEGSATSDKFWMHYTWEITEDRLSVYWRKTNESGDKNQLLFFMETPEDGNLSQINAAHGTLVADLPPFYEWFDEMNAFRMFINRDSYISNLKISKTGTPQATWFMFAKNRVKVNESDETAELPVLINNASDTEPALVEIKLIEGDASIINNFSSETLSFPTDGPSTQVLRLNITGDDDAENDKLIFELTGASGGYFATVYNRTRMELIIEDAPSSTDQDQVSAFSIFPNPARDIINLNIPENKRIESIELYNSTGSKVFEIEKNLKKNIDISGLQEGYYVVRVKTLNYVYRTGVLILRY